MAKATEKVVQATQERSRQDECSNVVTDSEAVVQKTNTECELIEQSRDVVQPPGLSPLKLVMAQEQDPEISNLKKGALSERKFRYVTMLIVVMCS